MDFMDWFNKTLQSRRSKTRLECVCCVTLLPYTSILLRRFTNEIPHEAFRIVVPSRSLDPEQNSGQPVAASPRYMFTGT